MTFAQPHPNNILEDCRTLLALFSDLPTVQFLIDCRMFPFLHTTSDQKNKKQNWTVGRPGNEARTLWGESGQQCHNKMVVWLAKIFASWMGEPGKEVTSTVLIGNKW